MSRNPVGEAPDEGIGETELQVAAITSVPAHPMLSIPELLSAVPEVSHPTAFVTEQVKNLKLAYMVRYLEKEEQPDDPELARQVVSQSCLVEAVLCCILRGRAPCPVVPKHLRKQLMNEYHRGSHFSRNKLFRTMSQQWWWQGMYRDIVQFVWNCPECTIVSGGKTVTPPLHPIEVQRPFQILAVDIMDLPLTKRGNRHALVFQDYFSTWPMVYAIPDQKAHRIVQILREEIVPVFGVPKALLSGESAFPPHARYMSDTGYQETKYNIVPSSMQRHGGKTEPHTEGNAA